MGVQVHGSIQAEKANEKAERARQQSVELDSRRRTRQIIREAQVARANALSNATNQGAAQGSALPGAYAQISGQEATAITGVEQNKELGDRIFAANREAASAATTQAIGGGLQTIGGAIVNNRGAIQRVGQYAFG